MKRSHISCERALVMHSNSFLVKALVMHSNSSFLKAPASPAPRAPRAQFTLSTRDNTLLKDFYTIVNVFI